MSAWAGGAQPGAEGFQVKCLRPGLNWPHLNRRRAILACFPHRPPPYPPNHHRTGLSRRYEKTSTQSTARCVLIGVHVGHRERASPRVKCRPRTPTPTRHTMCRCISELPERSLAANSHSDRMVRRTFTWILPDRDFGQRPETAFRRPPIMVVIRSPCCQSPRARKRQSRSDLDDQPILQAVHCTRACLLAVRERRDGKRHEVAKWTTDAGAARGSLQRT
jgi:hypothetical protein